MRKIVVHTHEVVKEITSENVHDYITKGGVPQNIQAPTIVTEYTIPEYIDHLRSKVASGELTHRRLPFVLASHGIEQVAEALKLLKDLGITNKYVRTDGYYNSDDLSTISGHVSLRN